MLNKKQRVMCQECKIGEVILDAKSGLHACNNCDFVTLGLEERKKGLNMILDEVDRSNKRMIR